LNPAGSAEGAKASAFDLGSTHLRLDLQGEAAKRLLAGKQGVRVVKAPSGGAGTMRLVLALPISEFDLTDDIKAELVAAVVAVTFVSAMAALDLAAIVVPLFVIAMGSLMATLLLLLMETQLASGQINRRF
jgi:hypothetical protein